MAEVLKREEKKAMRVPELAEYREVSMEREPLIQPALESLKTGWIPDIPDFRDYTMEHEEVAPLLAKLNVPLTGIGALPPSVDLRADCSPIETQHPLGSCTAQAGVGLLEYFERRAFGRHIDGSRLFLYFVSRRLGNMHGDVGCYLRLTMGGMTLFGVPHEQFWPYNPANIDVDPPAFVYALAQNYQAVIYYRLDPPGTPYNNAFVMRLKLLLFAKLPMMFGFTVYRDAITQVTNGRIPFPTPRDTVYAGHAVDIVGYDDNLPIKNRSLGGIETRGAFLIRNSWGPGWGMNGYGYLPYEYMLKGLTRDFWTLNKAEWVDTGRFGI